MQLVTIISTSFDKFKKLVPKALRFGQDDVVTAIQSAPFGIDSNPIKGLVAVYTKTSQKGADVFLGYLNKDLLAEQGETRLFSTNESGALQTYVWLKNDGNIEMGGNADNLVRYTKLNTALQQEVLKINAELAKIATAIGSLGGAYVVAPVTLDISAAKVDKIKTP